MAKYLKCGNLISIKFNTAEKLQDYNDEALASELSENRILKSLESVFEIIDARDGLLNNEFEIMQAKKLLQEARQQNQYQYEKDHQEQLILDNVIPMFPEHVNKTA